MSEKMREGFETWALSVKDHKFHDLSREDDGYWQTRTDTAWRAWQAALRTHENGGQESDLSKCPQCGGEADNGIDRCVPPSAYMCRKCCAQEDAERQESEAVAVARVTDEGFIVETGLGIAPGSKLYLAPPSAQAIETAAIMKCVEVCRQLDDEPRKDQDYASAGDCIDSLLALITQDGRTQLEEFGMRVASKAAGYGWSMGMEGADTMGTDLRSIITNLIGAAK